MTLQSGYARKRDFDPAARGHVLLYRASATNHCPGCGRSSWLVGRSMAECAFCDTALPLEHNFRLAGLAIG